MKVNHVLRALLCIQQVSGRVVARDDTSLANAEGELPGESCSLSAERWTIAGRDTDVDPDEDCEQELNELAESDNGVDEADLAKLWNADYTDISCDLVLLSLLAKFRNFVTPGFGRRDGASTTECERARYVSLANGRELAEVFWVRMDNIDGENPGDLFGSITATDSRGEQVIYRVARGDSQEIKPNRPVFLTGPSRSISAAAGFTIDVDLTDKDRDASPDDQVSYGQVSWSPGDSYDVLQEASVAGKYGYSTVSYVVMKRAVQADIEVVLINGDDENPADIFGFITALTKFGHRQLFNKGNNEYIDIQPGQRFPLTRSTLAVQIDDTLVLDVNVWDHDSDASPNDQVAKGKVKFYPQAFISTKEVVNGKFGQIEISVSFS